MVKAGKLRSCQRLSAIPGIRGKRLSRFHHVSRHCLGKPHSRVPPREHAQPINLKTLITESPPSSHIPPRVSFRAFRRSTPRPHYIPLLPASADMSSLVQQSLFSGVTHPSEALSPSNKHPSLPQPLSPTTSRAMTHQPSEEYMSISLGTIPTAAPVPARIVSLSLLEHRSPWMRSHRDLHSINEVARFSPCS